MRGRVETRAARLLDGFNLPGKDNRFVLVYFEEAAAGEKEIARAVVIAQGELTVGQRGQKGSVVGEDTEISPLRRGDEGFHLVVEFDAMGCDDLKTEFRHCI